MSVLTEGNKETLLIMAKSLYEMYCVYIEVGFSDNQAFELILKSFTPAQQRPVAEATAAKKDPAELLEKLNKLLKEMQ